MAEIGRRKCWFFPSILYKVETEKTDPLIQPFAGASISPHEVSYATQGSIGSYTEWDSPYAW